MNLDQISKDHVEIINKLIDKLSDGIAYIVKPRGVKLALIDAEKAIIEEIMKMNTLDPFMKRELIANWKKLNHENYNKTRILKKAIEHISSAGKPEEVEDDWFRFFFDKARLISEESVQEIWARILSEEINEPSSISRSLVHSLSIMSTKNTQDFHNLTRFCFIDYDNSRYIHPAVFITKNQIAYNTSRITPEVILQLSRLGLVDYNWEDEYIFNTDIKRFRYGNKRIEVINRDVYDSEKNKTISIGNVVLTEDGIALYRIAEKIYNAEILDFVRRKWVKRGYEVIIE